MSLSAAFQRALVAVSDLLYIARHAKIRSCLLFPFRWTRRRRARARHPSGRTLSLAHTGIVTYCTQAALSVATNAAAANGALVF